MHDLPRRDFVLTAGAGAVALCLAPAWMPSRSKDASPMYGLIGKMTTEPGKRDDLVAVLLEGVAGMPGCLSYVIAKDPADADALWITEVWDSKESHEASLTLPSVREAIERGRPMIASFGPEQFETEPVGGHGLVAGQ